MSPDSLNRHIAEEDPNGRHAGNLELAEFDSKKGLQYYYHQSDCDYPGYKRFKIFYWKQNIEEENNTANVDWRIDPISLAIWGTKSFSVSYNTL
jgi:hypothetical protein